MYKLRVQVVIYKNSIDQLRKMFNSILASSFDASQIQIVCGSNQTSAKADKAYASLLREYSTKVETKYFSSKKNLGHAAMHNKLFFDFPNPSELLLIINPDGMIGHDALKKMANRFKDKSVGLTEPRQLPFEHPKDFDRTTGDTTWSSGACLLVRSQVFNDIKGFDPRFFLHCDDIDLSWRIRNQGFRLIYCPDAIFFHDKLPASTGLPALSESESYFGPLGALLLAHKYGLKRGLKAMKRDLEMSGEIIHRKILWDFGDQINTLSTEKIRKDIPVYFHPWKFSKNRY